MIDIKLITEIDPHHHQSILGLIHETLKRSNTIDYTETIIQHLINHHYTPEWLNRKQANTYFLIALQDNKPIGTGILDDTEIKALFIDPAHQGKGIGKQILAQLETHAKQTKVQTIYLNSSITAYNFYQQQGCTCTETKIDKINTENIETYRFEKKINI
jgi:N-acetylglutamate synthase-like GNAT family acetyltransferase